MSVSSRHIVSVAIGALALTSAGGIAYACGGPKIHTPTPVPHTSTPKVPRPHFRPQVIVPGVNVNPPDIHVQQGSISVNKSFVAFGGNTSSSSTVFIGGGGFAVGAAPVSSSSLGALNVQGGEERIIETITEQVPVTEETCLPQFTQVDVLRPVQALCIDDKGTPHPASRLTADEGVAENYNGEVFRCLSGTYMQVTLGQITNGNADFAQGETFSCQKGQALVHGPGGNLTCAPQRPQRNCNERSLLRRHGPGIKLVRTTVREETCVPTQRTTYQTITKQVEHIIPNAPSPIVLDGGVGQGVY